MRAVLVIALSLGVLLGSGTASGEQNAHKATLKVAKGMPLTLKGTFFRPRERVLLIVAAAQKKTTKRVTAGRGGAFVARFSDLALDRCNALTVSAIGAQGSRARLTLPNVYCPPD